MAMRIPSDSCGGARLVLSHVTSLPAHNSDNSVMKKGRGQIKGTSSSRRVSLKETAYTAGGRAVRTNYLLNPSKIRAAKDQDTTAERRRVRSTCCRKVYALWLLTHGTQI